MSSLILSPVYGFKYFITISIMPFFYMVKKKAVLVTVDELVAVLML